MTAGQRDFQFPEGKVRTSPRTRLSNAWYRAAGRRIHGARQGITNARNRRTLERGRRPRTTQAADFIRSKAPVYRNRVNRATGRPHRDDRQLGRTTDAGLARMAPQRRADRAAAQQPRQTPPEARSNVRQARTRVAEAGSRALGGEYAERDDPPGASPDRGRSILERFFAEAEREHDRLAARDSRERPWLDRGSR